MRAAMIALVAFLFLGARAHAQSKTWTFTGRTEAIADDVRSRVTGPVVRIAVHDGQTVKKGELLAEIDPRTYRLDVEAAKAKVKLAAAKLESGRIKTENAKKLAKNKVVSQQDVNLNAASEAEADATVVGAKVDLERAELILSWTKITAPFDGRVSRVQAHEGTLVIGGQTPLMRVVAVEPLYVKFDVPEDVFLKMRDGMFDASKLDVAVAFALDKDYPHVAKSVQVDAEIDPKTGAAHFRAAIANPKGLISPGMSARVRVSAK